MRTPKAIGYEIASVLYPAMLADACRNTPARPGFDRVRMPGESGLRRRAEQLASGIELYPGVMATLAPWAEKLQVVVPSS